MNGSIECAFVGAVATKPEIQDSLGCAPPSLAFGVAVGDQWVHVAVFGDEAEKVAASLQSGDKVYVDGKLTLKSYEHNGETRHVLSVAALICDRIRLIGRARPIEMLPPVSAGSLQTESSEGPVAGDAEADRPSPRIAIEGPRDDRQTSMEDSPPCPF